MNAVGVTETPAPAPPPKSLALVFEGKSLPPEAKPNEIFETGIITIPFSRVISLSSFITERKSLTPILFQQLTEADLLQSLP